MRLLLTICILAATLLLNAQSSFEAFIDTTPPPIHPTQGYGKQGHPIKTFRIWINVINWHPTGQFVPVTPQQVQSTIDKHNQQFTQPFADSRFPYVANNLRYEIMGVTYCTTCFYEEKSRNSNIWEPKSYPLDLMKQDTIFGSQPTGASWRGKGVAATNPAEYLNIWVMGDRTSGYAWLPWSKPVNGGLFGNVTNWSDFNASGAITFHEFGHCYGLRHTFNGLSCSGSGDGIDDTPQTDRATYNPTMNTNFNYCGHVVQNTNAMDYALRTGLTQGQVDLANFYADYYLSSLFYVQGVGPDPNPCDILTPAVSTTATEHPNSNGIESIYTDLGNGDRFVSVGISDLHFTVNDFIDTIVIKSGWQNGGSWGSSINEIEISGDFNWSGGGQVSIPVKSYLGEITITLKDNINRLRYVGFVSCGSVPPPTATCDTTITAYPDLQGWTSSTWWNAARNATCSNEPYLTNGKQSLSWTADIGLIGEYTLFAADRGQGDRAADVAILVYSSGSISSFNWNQNLTLCGAQQIGVVVNPDSIKVISGNNAFHTTLDYLRLVCTSESYLPPVKRVIYEDSRLRIYSDRSGVFKLR